tara:strand:- start:1603 stop:2343 length:741 start_codon:yes stop_codon:yes gene_type:complete
MNKGFIIMFLISSILLAQEDIKQDHSILLSIDYSLQYPAGDLNQRFGLNSNVGTTLIYKTSKNWTIHLAGGLLFGSDVRETDVFDAIDGNAGELISPVGEIPTIRLFERGGNIDVSIGKYFQLKNRKHNCGFLISLGAGYLYHKIFIETITTELPQLNSELLKGYDRLTGGLLIKQFIGYLFFSNSNNIRFLFGIESIQGFTKDLRGYNYTTQTSVNEKRQDYLFGLKCGLIIPIKKRSTGKYYYY